MATSQPRPATVRRHLPCSTRQLHELTLPLWQPNPPRSTRQLHELILPRCQPNSPCATRQLHNLTLLVLAKQLAPPNRTTSKTHAATSAAQLVPPTELTSPPRAATVWPHLPCSTRDILNVTLPLSTQIVLFKKKELHNLTLPLCQPNLSC